MRHFFYFLLGRRLYYKALHLGFRAAYLSGYLRNKPNYRYHYLVPQLLRADDVVVDIGANLGYYTWIFSRCIKAQKNIGGG